MRMSDAEKCCWAFWLSFISAPVWVGLGGAGGALGHAFIEGCREKNSKEIVSTEAVALAAVLGNLFLMPPLTFGTLLSVASESSENIRNSMFILATLSCFVLSPISGVIGAATQKQSKDQLGYTVLAVFSGAVWIGLIGLCLGGIVNNFFCNRRDTPIHTNNAPDVVLARVPRPAPVVITAPDVVAPVQIHNLAPVVITTGNGLNSSVPIARTNRVPSSYPRQFSKSYYYRNHPDSYNSDSDSDPGNILPRGCRG